LLFPLCSWQVFGTDEENVAGGLATKCGKLRSHFSGLILIDYMDIALP